jgi:acyl-CoA carboxylase subunit beta
MTVLRSAFDAVSDAAKANREAMLASLTSLGAEYARIPDAGGAKAVARHRARGKLLPRERIELLLDRDAPFLELSPLAAWGTEYPLGGSVVTGIGVVEGVECVIVANDPTVRGGASNPWTIRKVFRANDIARENRLPMISLVESGGADLPSQKDIFIPGGRLFRDLTRLSAAGIPTIALVFGNSTAGGAYVPGMSDHVVMVRERAKVFLAGPPLVKMATGEIADDESLGGADMHARVSGLADYYAIDETDAIRLGRRIVARLNHRKPPVPAGFAPPRFSEDELLGIVPADLRQPFDPREVLARVVDDSDFDEFKPLYGTSLVTGWAQLHGYPIGVLANSRGVLFSAESQKAAQFIQLANSSRTPLVFLHNTTGYMVGAEYEQGGIIKHGALMINAVANSSVPHLSVLMGASYGAGHYGMCGRAFDPRFLFAWPSARSAVMGAQQLAGVLSIVSRAAASAAGRPFDSGADAAMRAAVEAQIEAESLPTFLSGRIYDDGIIDPRDTRTVLGLALSVIANAPSLSPSPSSSPTPSAGGFGVFRM